MSKLFNTALLAPLMLSLVFCKTKKSATANTPYAPSTKQVEITNARWPNSAPVELVQGHDIYTGKCTQCHKNYDITSYTENKWVKIIDKMSRKADLAEDEKMKLTKYLLSYREAAAQGG